MATPTLSPHDEMNVYASAEARFEIAARKLGLEEGVYRFMRYPNKEITVYIPVTKRADASTLDVVNRVKSELPRMQALVPDAALGAGPLQRDRAPGGRTGRAQPVPRHPPGR